MFSVRVLEPNVFFHGDAAVFMYYFHAFNPAFHQLPKRPHLSQRLLNSLLIIPVNTVIKNPYTFLYAYPTPLPILEHLFLQSSEESLTGRIVRETGLP